MTVLLIALGAAVGAPARYLTDRAVQGRHASLFPWGTFTVNLVGSFILGLVTEAATRGLDPRVLTLAGTGFGGALTTYSTFSYETLRLAEQDARFETVANLAASIVAGLGAASLGWAVGTSLR